MSFATSHKHGESFEMNFRNVFGCVFLGHCSLIFGLIGILANCVFIRILTRHKEVSLYFFNWLLTVLAVIDVIFLMCGVYEAIRQHFYQSYVMDHVYAGVVHPFRSMLMVSSIYMLIVLSYERFKAVCGTPTYQRTVKEMPNPWSHLFFYVGPVVSGSILFYIPKFWELEMKSSVVEPTMNMSEVKNTSEIYKETEIVVSELAFTPLRHNKIYVLWYVTILNTVMTSLLPFVLLVYLNLQIHHAIKRFHVRRSTRRTSKRTRQSYNVGQAIVLLIIVCVFAFCHILRFVLNIAEIINHENERKANSAGCVGVKYWMFVATLLSNFLIIVNSSANLFVYCIGSKDFRGILISTMLSTFMSIKQKLSTFSRYYCM